MRIMSNNWLLIILFIFIIPTLSNGSICQAQNNPDKMRATPDKKESVYNEITVKEVISGNTLRLEDGCLLRMIGVNTPENENNNKSQGEARLTGIQPEVLLMMGKEAAQFTRVLVEGKKIRIEFDAQRTDSSGVFLLGYVYLLNEEYLFVNAELIKKNYARIILVPPNFKYKNLFEKLQLESKNKASELWAKWISK